MILHPKLIELERSFQSSILSPLNSPFLEEHQVEVWVKRDDLIHSVISGNKWRKLKYNLNYILNSDFQTVVSMGGAYSNHLHALGYAAKQLEINAIAYVRGEEPNKYSPTLKDLQQWGMDLRFISRTEYRKLREGHYSQSIGEGEYWLSEGGSSQLALRGVSEIVTEIKIPYDAICAPCGTGATLAGLVKEVSEQTAVYGFSALKGADFLYDDVEKLLGTDKMKGSIFLDYHFGGFAKTNNDLLLFIDEFLKQYHIELDYVYTGKMFYGLFDLIRQGFFKPGQKIIAIHTGGLQGKRSN